MCSEEMQRHIYERRWRDCKEKSMEQKTWGKCNWGFIYNINCVMIACSYISATAGLPCLLGVARVLILPITLLICKLYLVVRHTSR